MKNNVHSSVTRFEQKKQKMDTKFELRKQQKPSITILRYRIKDHNAVKRRRLCSTYREESVRVFEAGKKAQTVSK